MQVDPNGDRTNSRQLGRARPAPASAPPVRRGAGHWVGWHNGRSGPKHRPLAACRSARVAAAGCSPRLIKLQVERCVDQTGAQQCRLAQAEADVEGPRGRPQLKAVGSTPTPESGLQDPGITRAGHRRQHRGSGSWPKAGRSRSSASRRDSDDGSTSASIWQRARARAVETLGQARRACAAPGRFPGGKVSPTAARVHRACRGDRLLLAHDEGRSRPRFDRFRGRTPSSARRMVGRPVATAASDVTHHAGVPFRSEERTRPVGEGDSASCTAACSRALHQDDRFDRPSLLVLALEHRDLGIGGRHPGGGATSPRPASSSRPAALMRGQVETSLPTRTGRSSAIPEARRARWSSGWRCTRWSRCRR